MAVNLLLHNVSHSDIQFSISSRTLPTHQSVARPKFNHFREITKVITESMHDNGFKLATKLKHYQKKNETSISPTNESVPVGFDFGQSPILVQDPKTLRLRDDSKVSLPSSTLDNSAFNIDALYFPLLAILIPKWLESIQYNSSEASKINQSISRKLILFLVTGRGTPVSSTSREIDNSTKLTGCLLIKFIEFAYPFIEVKHLHSSTNIFRYDENIVFVKRELLPNIDLIRDAMIDFLHNTSSNVTTNSVNSGGGSLKWKDYFRLTLSFADGSSARVSAINASLKHYRPDYMHFWQLKRFWNDLQICVDDVEWHSYEEISTETAMSIQATVGTIEGEVIQEMQQFIADFNSVIAQNSSRQQHQHDLDTFWLRKTKKPVLAVLLVEKTIIVENSSNTSGNDLNSSSSSSNSYIMNGDRNGSGAIDQNRGTLPSTPMTNTIVKKKFYRGTNMEVSMPTGSLCAERNAIGSALADDLSLCRKDLKMIAVYSPYSLTNILSPAAVASAAITTATATAPVTFNINSSSSSSLSSPLLEKAVNINATINYTESNQYNHSNSYGSPNVLKNENDVVDGKKDEVCKRVRTETTTFSAPSLLSTVLKNINTSSEPYAQSYTSTSSPQTQQLQQSQDRTDNYTTNSQEFSNQSQHSLSHSQSQSQVQQFSQTNNHSNQPTSIITTTPHSIPLVPVPPPMSPQQQGGGHKRRIMNQPLLGSSTSDTNMRYNTTSNSSRSRSNSCSNTNSMTGFALHTSTSSSSLEVAALHQNVEPQLHTSSFPSSQQAQVTLAATNIHVGAGSSTIKAELDRSVNAVLINQNTNNSKNASTYADDSAKIARSRNRRLLTQSNSNRLSLTTTTTTTSTSSTAASSSDNTIDKDDEEDVVVENLVNQNSSSKMNGVDVVMDVGGIGVDDDIFPSHSYCTESSRFIEVDENDINPIKPCGACLEWLKKIAEVNPRFSVITFTDVLCQGVYVEQIKE